MPETAQPTLLQARLAEVAEPLARTEAWIRAQLVPDEPALAPLLAHAGRFQGKRLRAAQVLLVGRACGGLRPEHVSLAGIIELIHASTLIHDDLLDEAVQRRGLASLHVEWGSHAAVLLGDWIFARAFRRSTEMEDAVCSRVLAAATSRVCAGEIGQNLTRGDFELTEAVYRAQIDAKTAALYEAGGRLGAHYAGAGPELQEACARHGLLAGRAFQIADDVLDLVGDEDLAGKSLGTDLAKGKMTLPLIRLRDRLDPPARARLKALFGRGGSRDDLAAAPLAADWAAAVDACRREVAAILGEAGQALLVLPESPARSALLELTDYLGERAH